MIELLRIGRVSSPRTEVRDDHWGEVVSTITLDGRFGPEALAGLSDFSHVEVIYHFDRVPAEKVETGARHPRNNPDWPLVGIFGQRGRTRPNRLGHSVCELLSVDGLTLTVKGLDAIDGTPVLDIKPVMQEFLPRGAVRQPEWATALMQDYYKA